MLEESLVISDHKKMVVLKRIFIARNDESAGVRTQDPRLKRAGEGEENQHVDIEELSNE